MKRVLLSLLLSLLTVLGALAQFRSNNSYNQPTKNSDQSLLDKIYFGGGGGFGAGTGYTYYSVFPVIGYRVTSQYSVGATFTYQRYNYTNFGLTPNGSYTQYGFGPFMRYNFNPLFFQTEFDMINAPAYNSNNELEHAYHSRWLWGLGYMFPTGRRGAINAMIMYDVLYRIPSVFSSPIVARVYFTF